MLSLQPLWQLAGRSGAAPGVGLLLLCAGGCRSRVVVEETLDRPIPVAPDSVARESNLLRSALLRRDTPIELRNQQARLAAAEVGWLYQELEEALSAEGDLGESGTDSGVGIALLLDARLWDYPDIPEDIRPGGVGGPARRLMGDLRIESALAAAEVDYRRAALADATRVRAPGDEDELRNLGRQVIVAVIDRQRTQLIRLGPVMDYLPGVAASELVLSPEVSSWLVLEPPTGYGPGEETP